MQFCILLPMRWQPLASFEAFGPNVIRAPNGVMVLSPVYVPTEWELS